MAALQYKDDHNRIAYLGRERGSEDFTDILSYLDHSPLRYALTHDPPVVFDSLVKQFWATATVRPNAAGSRDLVATIDGREVVVTESLIRAQLQLDDANGIFDMQIDDIFAGMGAIGYPTDRTLTFLKHHLSPQWRFLVHTILHCLSPKAGSWNQFPSSIATALICLSTETADRTPRPTFGFTRKLFANMKFRWEGQPMPLTPLMLAIAAAGDAADEENAAAHEAAASTAEAHPEPLHSLRLTPLGTLPRGSPMRQNGDPTPEHASPPTPPAQTFIFEEPLVFGPPPRPAGDVDPDGIESIIFGPPPRPHGYVDPDFVEPIIYGPQPRPDNYRQPEDLDNLFSMGDDTTHGGFHEDSPVRPDDAPTPTADAAGRAEDPVLLTRLSEKLDRCMGRIDSLETELGTTKKIMGDAILTLVSRDDVDLDGLHYGNCSLVRPDQTAVPSADVEPPMLIWYPAEFLAEDAQARKRFEEEQASKRLVQQLQAEALAQEDLQIVSDQRAKELDELMMRMTETDWLNLMMQVGLNPALARELLGADVNEDNFILTMTAIKEKKKRALADLRYRALKGKPMKQSEVTQMMRTLVKNQWCAAHNGTITMTAVKAMPKQQLIEEYEYICRRLEKDRLLSAQYNLFRPKPAITEPPSKRQRVDHVSSQPAFVPAATPHTADDPDSAGGCGAAMDSAGSHHESGVSPFADSADSSSPPNVSTDHIPIDVLFESTSGGINDFFLTSDAEEQIGMSRVAVDPDSDDEVLAEILFRGKYISGAGVVVVDKLPDDEIVDPRVKVETVSDYASSPPRSRRKHRGQNRRRKYFTYLKELLPHVYREDLLLLRRRMNRYFRLNPDVDVGLDLWRDVNLLCQSLHSDDVEDFWRTQDEWIVCSWKLYPKSSVHVLDLTNGKTVYMFVDKFYPIRATLLERMLRHKLTVPPSYCRDVVVAGSVIQTVQTGLQQSYECLASAPFACTARQMVFSSPWLTAKKESGSPWANGFGVVFVFTKVSTSPRVSSYLVKAYQLYLCCCKDWKLLIFDVATSTNSAVSFDAAVLDGASTVSAVCICCSSSVVPAGSSSSVPADYVSAGHVLVPADRDRIC
ncbi:hypothetical protein Tco_0569492 [Tanacetum coccineum]